MLPLIYTNATAAAIFAVACLVWVVPEWLGWRRQMSPTARKEAARADRGSMTILVGLQWIGVALNFVLAATWPAAAITWHPVAVFVVGIILVPLGVGLRWYSIRILGEYFTRDVAVSADQHVVERGPYRFVRHPSYTGTFVTMLGVGLATGNWASLLCLLVCVFAGHYYRVRVEEAALVHALGQPYAQYMQRTKRFIPVVF
jgi:protein-S-isoprenylcysteine O-methyltransferase Ste14